MFLVSGASALVFETVWFYQAGLGFGNGITASSVVLAGFMAGMALGGLLASRLADRARNALRTYAALECAVAVTGTLLCRVLPHLHHVVAALGSNALATGVRYGSACVLLAIPSTAIGATLPVLARAMGARDPNFARVLGLLYGVNTAGAVLGTLATEHVLLETFGVRGTSWVAASLNVVAALVAWSATKKWPLAEASAEEPQTATLLDGSRRGRRALWLSAAFGSGFLLLALEVVWLRILGMFLNDTPLAFATILALVLAGVTIGSLAAYAVLPRLSRSEVVAPFLAYAGGLSCLFGYLAYPRFLQRFVTSHQDGATVFLVALPLVLPACLVSGALYTALGAALRREDSSHASAAGRLSFFNTLGAGCGSLTAGFVLLPFLGMERALFVLLATYGVIGALTAIAVGQSKRVLGATGAAFTMCLLLFPFGFVKDQYIAASTRRWMRAGDTVAAVREGLTATIVHVVHRLHGKPLFDQVATNSYSMTVNDFAGRRYMKSFVILPSALHRGIRRAMVVGYGIGNTAQAMTDDPEIAQIDVADVSADLLDVSRGTMAHGSRHPLDDPRVHVHIEDGRYFLETTSERYDLITGEPPPPVVAGVVGLYTQEYFALVKSRLSEGGMASYWLPLMNISDGTTKSIVGAFCAAFDDCSLWQGAGENFMLLGSRGARGAATEERFSRLFTPARAKENVAIGIERKEALGAAFIGDARFLKGLSEDTPPLVDDWPKRIQQPGSAEERALLVESFRDTKKARARFMASAFVAERWPEALKEPTLKEFENQRLLDDLMSTPPRWAKGTRLLHHVLLGTPLRLPVLLLLKSSPDVQELVSRLPSAEQERDEWLQHRAAGRLAERDYAGALELLKRAPRNTDPMPDLFDYVGYGARRATEGEPSAD
jgi:predicted membrane-bound spermidine synthase